MTAGLAADDAVMHAHNFSPLSRPAPMVGLSPNITPYSLSTQPYFPSSPHSFAVPSPVLNKDSDDHVEAGDVFYSDSASFSLYHSAEQDEGAALSPISAASLSPPSFASSPSSVASVSSASPPPCSNCACCSTARRLTSLVAGLKQKTAHTQSLVAVYQQTQQRLQYSEQQFEQLTSRYTALVSTHQQCESRDKLRREDDDRRQVRLQAQDSHIVQLKAALRKLQHEKDERTEKEKSIKALQREKETLTKQTNAMRAQVAAMHATPTTHTTPTTLSTHTSQQPTQASDNDSAAADSVEWLPDTTLAPPLVVTELPPALSATATPPAVAEAASKGESAMFDVSRTMALAEAAITALKGEVRRRNDIIRQMRVEQREYRKALKEAGITLNPIRSSATSATRKRRRRDSKPDREKEASGEEMKPEELDAFAADVMNAMTAADGDRGAAERITREGMGGAVLTADGQEVAEEKREGEQKEKLEEAEKPVVVKKRGRPRIHPIKEKTTPARRGSRQRKVKVEPTSESGTIPQPSFAAAPALPVASVTSSAIAPPVLTPPSPTAVAPLSRHFRHKASAVVLQQTSAVLSSLLFAPAADEADLVDRCLALVCECPCLSHTLPALSSLLPPSTPVPFVIPVLPQPFSPVESRHHCLSAGNTALAPCCSLNDDVLHWDELSSIALRLLDSDLNAPVQRWVTVLQRLDEALLRRHEQRPSNNTTASPSLLELVCYHATVLLLSHPPFSSTDLPVSLTSSLLLHIARHTKQPGYVSCVLLSAYCSSQLPLSLLEDVAKSYSELLTHSPAQRTFHIKTMRLIAATNISQLPVQTSTSTSAPAPASLSTYPALVSLLSSELSSLSSASRDFVFGRLQSELILHASVTSFSSPQHYQQLSASLHASFHLLFLHLTFPAAQSMVVSAVLPAIPKAKSLLNSLLLLLTLPSLVTCALHHLSALSQRRPRPRKEESYSRALLAAVLYQIMESMKETEGKQAQGRPDGGLLMRGGGCEVVLRTLDELQRRREVKALKDDEEVRVLRSTVDGWLSGLTEAEMAVVCGALDEKQASGWELLKRVKEEVKQARHTVAT